MTDQHINQAMKQLWAVLATAYPHSFTSALGQYGGTASQLWQSELGGFGADAILLAAKKSLRMKDPRTGEPLQFPPTLPMMVALTEGCWAELNQLPSSEEAFGKLSKMLRHSVKEWPSDFYYNLYLRINDKFSVYNWLRQSSEKQHRAFNVLYSELISDLLRQHNVKPKPDGYLEASYQEPKQLDHKSTPVKPDFSALRDKLTVGKH